MVYALLLEPEQHIEIAGEINNGGVAIAKSERANAQVTTQDSRAVADEVQAQATGAALAHALISMTVTGPDQRFEMLHAEACSRLSEYLPGHR